MAMSINSKNEVTLVRHTNFALSQFVQLLFEIIVMGIYYGFNMKDNLLSFIYHNITKLLNIKMLIWIAIACTIVTSI